MTKSKYPYLSSLNRIRLEIRYESILARKNLPTTHEQVKGLLDSAEILIKTAHKVAYWELRYSK